MINFSNILDYIIEFTKQNSSSIIYISVGSEYYSSNQKKWEFHDNQQFPPFINDIKIKYMDTKILIILIDPMISEIPYIVNTSNSFLENSWKKSDIYENLFESEMGVNVITIKEYITWSNYIEYDNKFFNIKELMINITKFISELSINSLLFYQEYTGNNTIQLEYLIKKSYNYDDSKICIDITRGADLSCYFNLSNPEYYPIIVIDNSKLIYRNPKIMSNEELKSILIEFKKFKFGSKYCPFKEKELNYLIDKPDNLILFFQILKFDLISFDILKKCLISMIRQFFTMNTMNNFGTQMWSVKLFPSLKSRFQFITFNIELIESNLAFIDTLNKDNDKNKEFEDLFEHTKQHIIDNLLETLYIILKNITIKYDINEFEIDEFIIIIKTLPDKYKLIDIYNSLVTRIC